MVNVKAAPRFVPWGCFWWYGGIFSIRDLELILDGAEPTFQVKPRVDVMVINYLRRRLFISASIGAFQPESRDAFER